ncbi:MAG: iron dependent repressor, metal binding and dimerization domain protein, partial [Planctomycetota bacterium]
SISMLAGRTGIVPRYLRRYRLALDVDRQHLLRGVYERLELKQRLTPKRDGGSESVRFDFLLATRSWSARRLNSAIRRAAADELVSQANDGAIRLTALGLARAEKLTHDHRLWELYLITHAEIAPGQVDRGADRIEHVLDAAMIQRLEQMLDSVDNPRSVPGSPHPMDSHHDLENGLGGAT